jgi:predicted transcriptional regulator of viral defense system
MKASSKENRERLYRIAEMQAGYFTTKQAKAAGYTENNFPHYIRSGSWLHEYRGLYRLAHFPESDHSQLLLWHLWSRNREEAPQAVYSHQTALRIHDLSDIMPARLHVTVPMSFRRNSAIPEVLVLHRGDLPEVDVQDMHGFRITSPLRTLIDLVETQAVSSDIIEQALRQGLASGLITRREIRARKGHGEAMRILNDCMEGTST